MNFAMSMETFDYLYETKFWISLSLIYKTVLLVLCFLPKEILY